MKIRIYHNSATWLALKCKVQNVNGGTLHKWILDSFNDSIWIQGMEKTIDTILDKHSNNAFSLNKSKRVSSTLIDIRKDMISFRHQKEK